MAELSFNCPICERCWIDKHGVWEEIDADTRMLTQVWKPTLVVDPGLEQCSYCGQPTIFGVFVRDDPATVPYPSVKEE